MAGQNLSKKVAALAFEPYTNALGLKNFTGLQVKISNIFSSIAGSKICIN